MTDAPEKITARIYPNGIIMAVPLERDFATGIGKAVEEPYTHDDVKEAEKRAAYLRGLEDAAKVAEREALTARKYPDEAVCETYCTDIADTIRALAKEGGSGVGRERTGKDER